MDYSCFEPNEQIYGLTYGHWTVLWWQWLLGIPAANNPALDETGILIQQAQQNPYVTFLTGTFVNTIKVPHRKLRLPASKAILLPSINYQANFIEDSIFENEFELKKHVKADIDDIVIHTVELDGHIIPSFRVASDPYLFEVDIASDIPHGVNGVDTGWMTGKGGKTYAVADGYWTFLKPLSPGEYNIHLAGSCTGGLRRTEAFYSLDLV